MDRDWTDFKNIYAGIEGARANFEKACETIIQKMYPETNVQLVKPNPGDQGIDIFVGDIGQMPIIVYQCKFFLDSIDEPQKKQIRNSFNKAISSQQLEIKEWILCIPKILDIKENQWWSGWKFRNQKEYNIKIKLINGNQLINLAKEKKVYNQIFKIKEALQIDEMHKTITNNSDIIEQAEQKIRKGEYEIAIPLFNKALEKSIINNDSETEIRSLLGIAFYNVHLRNINKAEDYADNAILLSIEIKDIYLLSRSYFNLSQIYEIKGNILKAYELINLALSLSDNPKLLYDVAKIESTKARFSIRLDKVEEAKEIFIKFSEELKSRGGIDEVLIIELDAMLTILEGKIKESDIKFNEAIQKSQQYNLFELTYSISMNYGKYLVKHKRFDKANKIFEKAITISNKLSVEQKCNSKFAKAEVLMFQGRLNESLHMHKEVLALSKNKNLTNLAGASLHNIAQLFAEDKNYTESFNSILESIEFFQISNNDNAIISNLITLGSLCLESGYSKFSDEFISKFKFYKNSKNLQFKLKENLYKLAVRISENIGEMKQAKEFLNEFPVIFVNKDKEFYKGVEMWHQMISNKIHLSDTFKKLINTDNPLKLAGTDGATSINEANRWVLGPFIDIVNKASKFGISEIGLMYDVWGAFNFSRLILNSRAFPTSFHLTIDIASVKEAREACKSFLPITDCLTLVWKGNFNTRGGPVPISSNYGFPELNWQPKEYSSSFIPGDPIIFVPQSNALPNQLLDFYLNEAQDFVMRGKLIIAPAPQIGCINKNHSLLEEAYCQCTNSFSIQNKSMQIKQSIPLLYPYFPDINLKTLAKIIDDEEECLRKLRETLFEWSCEIEQNGFSDIRKLLYQEKFKSMVNPVYNKFKIISKKNYKSINTSIKQKEIFSEFVENDLSKISTVTNSTDSSIALWSTLKKQVTDLAGFASFRLMGLGKKWELRGPQLPLNDRNNVVENPEMFNWLNMPGEKKIGFRG